MPIEHPLEVDAFVNLGGQAHDLQIITEPLAGRKHSGQQQGSVNRRHFTLPTSFAALRVHPMIKPTVFLQSLVTKKTQCIARAFTGLFGSDPFSLGRNTKSGQTKPCSRDTRNVAMSFVQWRTIPPCAVGHQAGVGIGLLPKILKGTSLEIFKKSFIALLNARSLDRLPRMIL